MSDHLELDADDLLTTLEQVEETLSVMTGVVGHLKEQVLAQLDEDAVLELSAEEFLERCDNTTGTWH
ncbi:hypothetical protein A167_01011 [Alcanivorax sp. S71-1-4]|jgi:regulator of replication initiation timing|uniref:Uncharacterized protein n=1 Tax=Isoalcanivorax pacificus W11-5 TaxID=391936 RepID=A0A0B4XHG4_9GAMM|nr:MULTISPECIES: hypothetical protein [Alcanivoracaceae]AJD47589.1 hypothetical protein S7S_05855 [Isoalcanivorax pacificus W11-5]KAF0810330.1 hypothetical protein A167_01011 [Alcanivorax sp. S71-1-4]